MFQVAHHMKELSYVLYKDWYKKACDRHQSVKEEIVKKEEMAKKPQNEDVKNDEDYDEKPLQEYPHPGEMDFSWLRDTIDQENKFETLKSLTEEDLERAQKVDQLYLVKWRSLSYQEVTWEPLSKIQAYMGKIKDFEMFNR